MSNTLRNSIPLFQPKGVMKLMTVVSEKNQTSVPPRPKTDKDVAVPHVHVACKAESQKNREEFHKLDHNHFEKQEDVDPVLNEEDYDRIELELRQYVL